MHKHQQIQALQGECAEQRSLPVRRLSRSLSSACIKRLCSCSCSVRLCAMHLWTHPSIAAALRATMQMLLHSLLEGTGHVGAWLSLHMLEPGVACVVSLFWTPTSSISVITPAVCCIGRYCLGSPQGENNRSAVHPPEIFDHLAVANAEKTAGKPSNVGNSLNWAVVACDVTCRWQELVNAGCETTFSDSLSRCWIRTVKLTCLHKGTVF